MTFQQLEYIMAVDEYRYFVKAAEACGVTQSTLSLMIKKLEEELDVSLFDRDTHPVEVTEIGRKVIDEAKLVLYHAKQMVELTRSEKMLASGTLHLGMISTVASVLLPGLFKYCKESYPNLKIHAQEMRSATILDCLKKAEIDMGIVSSPVKEKELLELPLYHERFFAYVANDDPHASIEVFRRAELRNYPLWVMRDGIKLLERNTIPSEVNYTYEELYEGSRVGILIQVASENGGITIVPETHLRFLSDDIKKGLRNIIDPEPSRVISLVIRKDYIHEKLMNIIIKAIKTRIPVELHEPAIKADYIKL
ncbi:MAG: LysR family transcriptional regulator [Bacteroidales bacterium]|nr:LysR family transcriptional regulator [Bacteroidales bacterium]